MEIGSHYEQICISPCANMCGKLNKPVQGRERGSMSLVERSNSDLLKTRKSRKNLECQSAGEGETPLKKTYRMGDIIYWIERE